VIAAVNGYALGGGCELAISCDVRMASENARLGLPELNLGIIPGAGGTQKMTRLVGRGKAKELILTGDIVSAEEAEQGGLVNRVVPAERLSSAVWELAGKMMNKGPLALRLAKACLDAGADSALETGLALERFA
jgi:enoyl-CoA hydratase